MKLERDAIAFLEQLVVDGVRFPKSTCSIFFIVAMLALGMVANKNLFDMRWGMSDMVTMFVNAIQEQAQHNALRANVNAGENPFALYARFGVNEHIFTPTIAITNFVAAIVSQLVHRAIKSEDEFFIFIRDQVKSLFPQKIIHHPTL